jgi:alkaline phosphatase
MLKRRGGIRWLRQVSGAEGRRALCCGVAVTFALVACADATESTGAADPWQQQGREAVARARALVSSARPARNAILFIGDGLGISTVTAARILEGQLRGGSGEEHLLSFERLPHVALAKTYNTNQQVADSAGTATAMLTGSKTRAGVINVDETVARGDVAGVPGHRLETLFERAEARGLATGVVTTAQLTHATPAAAYAHSPERGWYDDTALSSAARATDFPDIARQLVELRPGNGLEVALGGGWAHFLPAGSADPHVAGAQGARRDGRDLVAEWRARSPRSISVWSRAELLAVDAAQTDHLLGLFASSHMKYESDRSADGPEPSLAEMTGAALDLLSRRPKGYVLLVEGGRIDHGHHEGNAYRALHDVLAFASAVETALARVDLVETLVVVTGDHSHVFTLGGYPTRGNPILGLVIENDARGEPKTTPERDAIGLPYTTLGYRDGPGASVGAARRPGGRRDLSGVDTSAPDFQQNALVPFDYESHGGEDVPIYAGGSGAHLFHGVQEQSYVYHAIAAALGWDGEAQAK